MKTISGGIICYKNITNKISRTVNRWLLFVFTNFMPLLFASEWAFAILKGSEFMEDYSLLNFIINAFIFILVAWFVAKRDKNSLIDKGDQVIIRSTVFARVFKSISKVVNKSDILKVQVAGK